MSLSLNFEFEFGTIRAELFGFAKRQ